MVNWFKKEFGQSEIEKAKQFRCIHPKVYLMTLVKQVPPGSLGLNATTLLVTWVLKTLEAKGRNLRFW